MADHRDDYLDPRDAGPAGARRDGRMMDTALDHYDLNAEYLFRAMPIVDHALRLRLAGVLIEPIPGGGAWIVATDGIVMLVQRDREAVAPAAIMITVRALELPKDDDDITRDWRRTRVRIPAAVAAEPQVCPVVWEPNGVRWTHIIAESAHDASTFPDWRKVIGAPIYDQPLPGKRDCAADRYIGLRSDLLELVAPGATGIRIRQRSPRHAILVTTEDPDVLGIIAPRAISDNEESAFAALLSDLGRADLLS